MNEVDNMLEKFKTRDKHRFEAMLFNNETVLKSDFKYGRILGPSKNPVIRPRPKRPRSPYTNLKDTQTMMTMKRIPFDLFIKPKEIVRTNPKNIQPYWEADVEEREEVRKTRPRVVITPAVRIDDGDEKSVQILVKDMYSSTTQRDYSEVAKRMAAEKYVVSPLASVPAPAKPIKIKSYTPRLVHAEWRMDSAAWDRRQPRIACSPTTEFWTRPRPKDQPMGKPLL